MATSNDDSESLKQSNIVISDSGFRYFADVDHDSATLYTDVTSEHQLQTTDQFEINKYNKNLNRRQQNEYEDSSGDFNTLIGNSKVNNDITYGLGELEFEAGIADNEQTKYERIRLNSHVTYIQACAHAAYFVGIANKFKRHMEDIKNNQIKYVSARIINETAKQPGLWIGIIGGGRLARQLATALIEYADVNPNEIRISTRQPEILNDLKEKGIDCFFDNKKLSKTVNIMFLCVSISQLQSVIDDIKATLPKKCIIYSFVRTVPPAKLRNLINPEKQLYIVKPEYNYNSEYYESFTKWNYTLDTMESFKSNDMIALTNPFDDQTQLILPTTDYFITTLFYAWINVCSFLKFNKKNTILAIRAYALQLKPEDTFKFDGSYISEPDKSESFALVNLIDSSTKPTIFSQKLQNEPMLKKRLSESYLEYFAEITKLKYAYQ